jgi:IS5 family transposase
MNLIRTTKSICPVCYRVIDAEVYEANGAVWMEKRCTEHGAFKDLCWSDYALYKQFESNDIAEAMSGEARTARLWAKKGIKSYFGCKLLSKLDTGLGLIRALETTPASVHDSQVDLSDEGEVVYRDKGFHGARVKGYSASDDETGRSRSPPWHYG